MLPGLDGLTVCRKLRATGRSAPILILSARDMVEDRVRVHGGRVEVESTPAEGSRFTVSLPLATAAISGRASPPTPG